MDYSQFMNLMETEGLTERESVQKLQEFVKEFPYFQTGQTLLAKAMHEQQHVRFEKQLKIASAYSGDRKILYHVINPKPTSLFSERTSTIDSAFITQAQPEPEVVEN